MNYEEKIELLIEKGLISNRNDAFFPDKDSEDEELYIFFQKYMELNSFDFDNPIFFFGAEKTLNAWAWKHNGLDVICINKYAFQYMDELIGSHQKFIIRYLEDNGINTGYDNELPATVIMKQVMEMFLFYHELGHLVQEQEPILSSLFTEEIFENEEFNILDHICEYDSDLFASVRLVTHIFRVYKRQANLNSDEEKVRFLEDSCIIATSSYIMYRFSLFPDYGDFYTKKSTHPHIIFRIIALTIHITKATIDNSPVELSRERILSETINFVDAFTKEIQNLDVFDSFIEMGRNNFQDIKKYMHELNQEVVTLEGTAHVKSQKKIKHV